MEDLYIGESNKYMLILTVDEYIQEVERYFVPDFDDRDIRKIRKYLVERIPFETGITPREFCNLERKRISQHIKDGTRFITIFVKNGTKLIRKGGKLRRIGRKKKYVGATYKRRKRDIVVNSDLSKIILRFIETHDSPYIMPKCTSNYNVRSEPLGVRGIQKLLKSATNKWNMHEAIHNKLGARHYFKHFTKYLCYKNGTFYDEEEMRKMMGHSPSSAHAMYDPYLNLEICFDMVENFAKLFHGIRPKMQKTIETYLRN